MKLSEFPKSKSMQQCPCCDYFSLAERGKSLVCPVCFWEDDCEDPSNPQWESPSDLNDEYTLKVARKNFQKHGAWREKFSAVVVSEEERRTLKYVQRNV